MMLDLVTQFLDSLTWGYRRYNYWAGNTWLTGKLPINRDDAIKLVRGGEVIGVWQCFGYDVSEPCILRDILVFEADVSECEGRESLDCVLNWARSNMDVLRPVLSYGPVLYWNGGKSLYIIIYFTNPVPADYVLRDEWVEFSKAIGFDMQETQARHAIRVLGTRHHRTNKIGTLLDTNLKPINTFNN
ncbi:hypothetical protein [Vulcanisaeta souniana]|uniref:Uncharacterized protein n=2 Tax=Vulcanisaeta souniana JCM 11219 TaxID=1293586 RepID=A0A830E376_9CREN|nr:hypothetical protein [Vulcanisaeta souniana]GGI78314.1 hypothetical protein GCM10007112_13920 [Vulcanisaeta souniana JCM 11219]